MPNSLNADQQLAADAFFEFLCNPEETCMVISGKPGTGKTYLVQYLLSQLPSYEQPLQLLWGKAPSFLHNVHLTATTNQAARVLADAAKQREAVTIYSHLGLRIKENYQTGRMDIATDNASIVRNQLLIIDESSYVTEQLLGYIHRFTHNCKIVFLGDRYQLVMPFSKSSAVFEQGYRTAMLTISERTRTIGGSNSRIAQQAEAYCAVIDGATFPPLEPDQKTLIQVSGPEFKAAVDAEFSRPDWQPQDAKIIAWSNKTVQAYNQYVRTDLLGKSLEFTADEVVISNSTLMGYGIFTDTPYTVRQVLPETKFGFEGWRVVLADHKQIRTVFMPADWDQVNATLKALWKAKNMHSYFNIRNAFADLRPAYASTVYKAQGSTFHTVFLDLSDLGRCTSPTDTARMLNTGISRASHRVYLYGDLPARYQPQPVHAGGTPLCQILPSTTLSLPT